MSAMTSDDYEDLQLDRDGYVPLRFRGRLLAEQSSYSPGARRWAELKLYDWEGKGWVLQSVGRSTLPNEVDLLGATPCATVAEVRKAITRKRPNEHGTIVTYIPALALDLIDEAAELDPRLEEVTAPESI